MSQLDSRILDANSEALGVSVDDLMDNAGKALGRYVLKEFFGKKVLIVCGSGNNGGDGLAAAYHLRDVVKATAVLLDPDKVSEASKKRISMLRSRPKAFGDVAIEEYDVILDCVLGTGAEGPVRDSVSKYIDSVKSFKGIVVSADVPTGFGTSNAIVPNSTVTFHDIKDGMDASNSGKIEIAEIGIPRDAWECVGPGDMLRYPVPADDSHKGDNGRLLVIGGGPYIGAPAMSALAALRTGADIVRIATPSRSFIHIASMSPSFIMHELSGDVLNEDHVDTLIELSRGSGAVLIGPGLGQKEETKKAVSAFLEKCEVPAVIDADAIRPAARSGIKYAVPAIFTPHRRELSEMLDDGMTASEFAAANGDVTIVSKGKIDEIANGKIMRKNKTGTPAMTVGGTGDALAGTIAALASKGMNAFDAACLGTYICGKAGEKAFLRYSYGMLATDMIDCIPEMLREYL